MYRVVILLKALCDCRLYFYSRQVANNNMSVVIFFFPRMDPQQNKIIFGLLLSSEIYRFVKVNRCNFNNTTYFRRLSVTNVIFILFRTWRSVHRGTFSAASFKNSFDESLQVTGTVNTHFMSNSSFKSGIYFRIIFKKMIF